MSDFTGSVQNPSFRPFSYGIKNGNFSFAVVGIHCLFGIERLFSLFHCRFSFCHSSCCFNNGLTADKAQELGERFYREPFPGHQAIICAHPDGHNQFGNIHVHIVINCLWIENVSLLPYLNRPAEIALRMSGAVVNAPVQMGSRA